MTKKILIEPIITIPDFVQAVILRYDVFVNEQGFLPGWEPDMEDLNV